MVWADQKKMFASKRDYVTLTSLVSTNTAWMDAIAKLDTCAKYSPLTFQQLCDVRMLFAEQEFLESIERYILADSNRR